MSARREFSREVRAQTRQSKTPEYRHWINMISRCENPNTPRFEHYGGRGIKISARWRSSFSAFLEDMGRRPSPRHSVDRVDVNGDYEPSNCRWATQTQQMRNFRGNRLVTLRGVTMTLADACDLAPVPYNTVLYRIKRGWPVDDAVMRPQQKGVRL
jgi:hypothetical protein